MNGKLSVSPGKDEPVAASAAKEMQGYGDWILYSTESGTMAKF
jgi:hypothetical protein